MVILQPGENGYHQPCHPLVRIGGKTRTPLRPEFQGLGSVEWTGRASVSTESCLHTLLETLGTGRSGLRLFPLLYQQAALLFFLEKKKLPYRTCGPYQDEIQNSLLQNCHKIENRVWNLGHILCQGFWIHAIRCVRYFSGCHVVIPGRSLP